MKPCFEIPETPLERLKVIERKPIGDHRGYPERMMFCAETLQSLFRESIVQINHALTAWRGTVRGMHFRYPPPAETKVASCPRAVRNRGQRVA